MKKLSFEQDVVQAMESIKNKMGKEYRRDKNITVEVAVKEIYDDLDVSLLGAPSSHSRERVIVVGEAMNRLKVYDSDASKKKVSEFLPSQYLIHPSLRSETA